MGDGVVRLTGPKKRSYWVDQNTSNLGLSGSIHPCLSSVWWRAATVSSSICTAAAAVIVSIRVVRPIILHHRLRSSSRQPPERASGTRDPSPSRRAARNGRLHGRLLHVPLLRLQPQIHPFRLPEFQVTPISSINYPCYSTATARFSFNLVICVCSN